VEFGRIIVNKLRKRVFFLQISTELCKKCEKIPKMQKMRKISKKNAIMHAKMRSHFSKVSNYALWFNIVLMIV